MKPGARVALLVGACFLSACTGDPASSSTGTTPASTCPDGLVADASGDGCVDVLPADDCGPLTRAAFGQSACEPVYSLLCPDGFRPDPSQWGCVEIMPPAACAPGTIEELGQSVCVPIDDCNAAFPPANATLFVDASGPSDATHFTSISSAVAAASSGAVISVAGGTYTEGVSISIPLSIVGKCASEVIVKSPGASDANPGVLVLNAKGVSISGLTLQGHENGVAEQNGDLTVTDVEIDGARALGINAAGGALHVHHTRISGTTVDKGFAFGALSTGGATLELDRTVIADSAYIGVLANGGNATIGKSIIETTHAGSGGTDGGVITISGSQVTIDQSAIVQNGNNGVVASDKGSSVTMTSSTIDGVELDTSGVADGFVVNSAAGGSIKSSSIFGCGFSAVMENDADSSVDMTSVAVVGSGASPEQGIITSKGSAISLANVAVVGTRNYGLFVQDPGSAATVTGSVFRDTMRVASSGATGGTGVVAGFGAALTMKDSTVANSTVLGMLVGGNEPAGVPTQADLQHVVVSGVRADGDGYGRGVQVSDSAEVEIDSSAIVKSAETGVLVSGDGTMLTMRGSVVRGAGSDPSSTFGYGFSMISGASAFLSQSVVRESSAVALVFDSSSAVVDGSFVSNNPIGVYANGVDLEDVGQVPDSPTSGRVVISSSTKFIDNQTRVSSDQIPIPEALPADSK